MVWSHEYKPQSICQACLHREWFLSGSWPSRRWRMEREEESFQRKIQKWLSVFLSFMILCRNSSDHLSGSRGRTKAPAGILDAQNSSYQADPLSAKFLRSLISLVHHFSSSRKHTKCLNPETLVSH